MATELRDFAERLLLGPELSDKLSAPEALSDEQPGAAWRGRAEPGRVPELALSQLAEPFVRDAVLVDAAARGRALHFFANHELLAIELMALALLRFVDAPPAFRRGLAATIQDEQRHLGLYLERMRVLGTEFGDAPLGGFFWRTVADLDAPADFVAHMSLTFEQANLDHAAHYRDLFASYGDGESAAVLAEVYADEIKHVGFGLRWFARWRPAPPARTLFDMHGAALVAPVTLRRARGRGFDAEGRRRAGLPADYVEALANLPSARGRKPVVHLFDPTVELELSHRSGGYTPSAATRARIEDLELLPAFFARADDVVLVRRRPSEAFLTGLRQAGVTLPELVVTDLDASPIRAQAPSLAHIDHVQPWGWTPRIVRRLERLRARATQDPIPAQGWPAQIFSKARGVAVLRRVLPGSGLSDPETLGVVARSLDAVDEAVDRFRAAGHSTVVCKASWGSAGRGLQRLLPGPVPQKQRAWLTRMIHSQGLVVVEPWLDRVCDLSLRLTILTPGTARIDGVGRVLVDARGQYRGAVIGKATAGLDGELLRFFHGQGQGQARDPKWLDRVWRQVAQAVADELAPSGYVGTVGVDAIVHRDHRDEHGGELRLRPVIELNTRVHMGHVAVHLERLVARGCVGLWRILPKAAVPDPLPPPQPSAKGLRGGVLLTNDPVQAQVVVGALAVAKTLEGAAALLDGP